MALKNLLRSLPDLIGQSRERHWILLFEPEHDEPDKLAVIFIEDERGKEEYERFTC